MAYVGVFANPLGYSARDGSWSYQDWQDSWTLAKSAGITIAHILIPWNQLEGDNMQYNFQQLTDFLAWTSPLPVSLNISVVDNPLGVRIPSAYNKLLRNSGSTSLWTNLVVIQRFQALLRNLLPLMGSRLFILSIGNEIDSYFDVYQNEITGFASFFGHAYESVKAYNKDINVTSTFTSGAYANVGTRYLPINKISDVIQYTYYPVSSDFIVKDPALIPADITNLAISTVLLGKKIAFQEMGCPSGSTYISSSETIQDNCYSQMCGMIAAIKNTYCISTNFTFFNDFPSAAVNIYVPGVIAANSGFPFYKFQEFFKSLGMKRETGVTKPAYTTWASNIGAMT